MPLRGKVGDVALVGSDFIGANLTRGLALIAAQPSVRPALLHQMIGWPTTRARLQQAMNGSALQEIPIATLRAFEVALPNSPQEQQAIAGALTDADALVESLEHLLAKKRDIKQGAMQELLTGKRRLPGFTDAWPPTTFGEVAQLRRERLDPRTGDASGFCIELEHLESGTGRLLGSIPMQPSASQKSLFGTGDVLFGKLRAYLRKYWLADRDGVCSTELWVLRARPGRLDRRYLYEVVGQDRFIEVAATAYGTHMPRSDWTVVQGFKFMLPPLREQAAIAEILADMDAEIAAIETKLTKARQLKQGMMHQLLTGRIRLV